MAATLFNLIVKGCSISYGSATSAFREKLSIIAGNFSTLDGFKSATIASLNGLRTVEGNQAIKKLTEKEEKAILSFQGEIEPENGLIYNFIKILTKDFLDRQLKMISDITIESFNANPILCTALSLKTPEEFVRFNAYQAIGRSIVTSMGFLIQSLLEYSNVDVFDGKYYSEGNTSKWDIVIDRLEDVKIFIEIKSGFNDLNTNQIKNYANQIKSVESEGNRGYIGITYGRKKDSTVASGLLRTYLPDWENKTLVGKELWDFVSEHEDYHRLLLDTIDRVANATLHNTSIVGKIEEKIMELIDVINDNYTCLDEYYESLW